MPDESPKDARKRERSHRYPGRSLADSVDLARVVEEKGLDGMRAGPIASALGYSSVRTNAFSALLSAARQFGLVTLKGEAYGLTPLARSILHPVGREALPSLLRSALWEAPLYAELARRLGGKVVPEESLLANLLYHDFGIIASAKNAAAATFVESAKFAGAIDAKGWLRPDGVEPDESPRVEAASTPRPRPAGTVRLDLELWDDDAGKIIRARAPKTITRASFERFLKTFELMVKIE